MFAFTKDTLGWGFLVWLVGYALGFVFFILVPAYAVGWFVTPLATAFTLWVLFKKITSKLLPEYIGIAVIWTALAVGLDYIGIVMLIKPEDGYYKLDVYLYYALTFLLPIMVGWYKSKRSTRIIELDD